MTSRNNSCCTFACLLVAVVSALAMAVLYFLTFWGPIPSGNRIGQMLIEMSKANGGIIELGRKDSNWRKVCFFPNNGNVQERVKKRFAGLQTLFVHDGFELIRDYSNSWFVAMRKTDQPVVYIFPMSRPSWRLEYSLNADPGNDGDPKAQDFCSNEVAKIALRRRVIGNREIYFFRPVY